jgi:hypothetical protein
VTLNIKSRERSEELVLFVTGNGHAVHNKPPRPSPSRMYIPCPLLQFSFNINTCSNLIFLHGKRISSAIKGNEPTTRKVSDQEANPHYGAAKRGKSGSG